MKAFKHFALIALLLSVTVEADVRITVNNTLYMYKTPPSMVEVLTPVALNENWYWSASKLYQLPAAEIEQERAELLAELDALKAGLDAEAQDAINALQYFMRQWRLAKRILLPIDYDRARLATDFNRRFDHGEYILQLSRRPSTVTFWGALQATTTLNHKGVSAIADYIPALPLSPFADANTVWLVQPHGVVAEVGVARWNTQHVEAMPGAFVYVPFAFGWFNAEMQQLNQRLVALSLHRVD